MNELQNEGTGMHVVNDYPTPKERANFVIIRLEQFIRNGRSFDEGMSFKKWQTMAGNEIAMAIAEAENTRGKHESILRRLIFVVASAMVTIGFWGAAASLDNVNHLLAGIICTSAGGTLLFTIGVWRFGKWNNRRKTIERSNRMRRIAQINKRIKQLELELGKEEDALKATLEECRKLSQTIINAN